VAGTGLAARRARPDLLHIPSFAAPLLPAPPLVVTIHDAIPFMLPAYRASRAMRVSLAVARHTTRRARLVIAPSRAAAADIAAELGIPSERIRITPEAAGPEYRPTPDPRVARDRAAALGVTGRYVFNVGGLDVRKNIPLLLEAFARLRQLLDEPMKLVIAGGRHSDNPSVFPPLAPVIRRLGLEGAVVLTGRLSEADKIALMQGAACYVTPSYLEGFGLTALEAMACGVPTIAANRSSFPEVVGEGGLLVELDPEAICAVMALVLANQQVATDLKTRGIARAAEFSWRRTAELTLDVYREALSWERGGRV
jgi:glycosyltransferase involved in cell wall biosynthesis